MAARRRLSIALLLLALEATLAFDPKLQAIVDAEDAADLATEAAAMREQLTPEEMQAQRLAQEAVAKLEAEEVRKAVAGEEAVPTRYAPNGDSLDAADFLAELGERSMRCSACEMVAEKLDDVIPLLVKRWPEWNSAERAKHLRPAFVQRGCKQFDTMQVALIGEDGCVPHDVHTQCWNL